LSSIKATHEPRDSGTPGSTAVRRRNKVMDARLIESRLEAHPDVLEAEVVGRPLKRRGRALWAFVLLKQGSELKKHQLASVFTPWVKAELPAYMAPDHYRAILRWPLLKSGAINRGELANRTRLSEQQMKRPKVPRSRGPINQILFEGVVTEMDMIARTFTLTHRTEDGTRRSAAFLTSRAVFDSLKRGKYYEVTGCFSANSRVRAISAVRKESAVRISLADFESVLERL
jgi:hypothetical protein